MSIHPHVHLVGCTSELDEEADVYSAELVWPSKVRPYVCDDLKPTGKNSDEDINFSFNVIRYLMPC
jgi:hypothetical protein